MTSKVAIAFLHGGKQGSWVWDEVRAAITLQAGGEAPMTIALDVPGCGSKRGRDVSALTLSDVIDELAVDLTACNGQLMLVGHSQGGTVLPRLAAARRGQIEKLVYITCSVPEEGQTLTEMLGTGVHGSNENEVGWPLDPATHSPEQLFTEMFCNDMTDAERGAFLTKLGSDNWPSACATTDRHWGCDAVRDIPASYVFALRDRVLTPPWQERFAARFNASQIERVDAGHQLLQTRSQAVAEILLAELQDIG